MRPVLLNMTFAVVVLSIVVQGPTIRRLFTHEELNRLLRS
jgi:NhaP-type Na+/H+ or K+/H+ antiporter